MTNYHKATEATEGLVAFRVEHGTVDESGFNHETGLMLAWAMLDAIGLLIVQPDGQFIHDKGDPMNGLLNQLWAGLFETIGCLTPDPIEPVT